MKRSPAKQFIKGNKFTIAIILFYIFINHIVVTKINLYDY